MRYWLAMMVAVGAFGVCVAYDLGQDKAMDQLEQHRRDASND